MFKKQVRLRLEATIVIALVILAVIFFITLILRPQWFFSKVFSQARLDVANLAKEYDPRAKTAIFGNRSILVSDTKPKIVTKPILGANDSSALKLIFVDLTKQKLIAYEGDKKRFEFPVSTGKFNLTPTGRFRIWIKLRYTRMKGGSQALGTYYDLPNVPYTMYFYNDEISKDSGYGIHGAYWHDNFGQPMSHGCVNMREEDVAQLYYWSSPVPESDGTTKPSKPEDATEIVIYGQAPV